ncbi:Crp/Fnr family transcriptional regulator [Nocardioides caldifontis]|uniref:Crp/Fnr family transcriptional regulator n=1 Tax=Nocardioides caldifontis TaxID=2588938 RepID=UPI001EF08210|nr:cyclic nucleotide-binding domain-containing protein [Nocardioides caldifontis]
MPESVSLDHIDRFSNLSDDEVAKIARVGTYVTVPADWALMGEGTSADKAYLLISGEVSVRQHGKEIARLGPGDVFGEMGIVGHRLRTATVVSLSRLECLHFTREKVEQLADEIPEFRKALEVAAAERSMREPS